MNNMYRVFFYNTAVTSPLEIQGWLNEMYAEGFDLFTCCGDYFIFKSIDLGK